MKNDGSKSNIFRKLENFKGSKGAIPFCHIPMSENSVRCIDVKSAIHSCLFLISYNLGV